MKSGEWTRGMALVLASGVEAVVLMGVRDGEESSWLSILKGLREFKSDVQRVLGEEAHEDSWRLIFESAHPHVFSLTVEVSLLCEDHSPHGHRWRSRTVVVTRPNDTRPGEYSWIFGGEIEKPLEFRYADHWSVDS